MWMEVSQEGFVKTNVIIVIHVIQFILHVLYILWILKLSANKLLAILHPMLFDVQCNWTYL